MNIILGYGEVGKALEPNIKKKTEAYDKGEWEELIPRQVDILHVCIPYSDDFVKTVKDAQRIFVTKTTVIHSTVKPGTSKKLGAVYSPSLGRHHDGFSKNMRRYKKPIAGPLEPSLKAAYAMKFKAKYWSENTDELEFAKVMSTAYMYWNLVYEKLVHANCKNRGYDFAKVYTGWNLEYNKGMRKYKPNWQRPIYTHDTAHKPGGHCLTNNVYLDDNMINQILKSWQDHPERFALL